MIEEVRAESWIELHERLFEGAWNETLGRFRSDLAFRGQADAAASLATTLARLGGDYVELERSLLRNFRKYARRDAVAVDSPWDWLALAKHHNLPTRVVDWSYSPYVALHFATVDLATAELDGAVWCVDFVRTREELPERLAGLLEEERSNVFTTELLGRAVGSLDEWVAEHPDLVRKLVIPAELKWEVRDKLDQANVTERVLFPGLDGISRWVARYYTPRTDRPGA